MRHVHSARPGRLRLYAIGAGMGAGGIPCSLCSLEVARAGWPHAAAVKSHRRNLSSKESQSIRSDVHHPSEACSLSLDEDPEGREVGARHGAHRVCLGRPPPLEKREDLADGELARHRYAVVDAV